MPQRQFGGSVWCSGYVVHVEVVIEPELSMGPNPPWVVSHRKLRPRCAVVPYEQTTDAHGNVNIVDYENHANRVVDRKGTIHTVAGSGTAGFSGDGKSATRAQLNRPYAVAVESGAMFIADTENGRVRRLDLGENLHNPAPRLRRLTVGLG